MWKRPQHPRDAPVLANVKKLAAGPSRGKGPVLVVPGSLLRYRTRAEAELRPIDGKQV